MSQEKGKGNKRLDNAIADAREHDRARAESSEHEEQSLVVSGSAALSNTAPMSGRFGALDLGLAPDAKLITTGVKLVVLNLSKVSDMPPDRIFRGMYAGEGPVIPYKPTPEKPDGTPRRTAVFLVAGTPEEPVWRGIFVSKANEHVWSLDRGKVVLIEYVDTVPTSDGNDYHRFTFSDLEVPPQYVNDRVRAFIHACQNPPRFY